MPSIEFATVLLAALGIEAVLDNSGSRSRARRWHLPVLAVATGGLLLGLAAGPSRKVLHLVMSGGPYSTSPRPYVFGALIGTALILVALAVVGAFRGRIAAVGLCGVLLFEAFGSFVYPELAATRSPVVDMKPVTWLQGHLGDARFYSLYSNPAIGPEYGGPIAPDYGSYFGLASADYLDIPDPELYVNYVHDHLDSGAGSEFFGTIFGRHAGSPSGLAELGKNVAAFESIGVRYIVTGAAIRLSGYVPSATEVYDDGLVAIWQLPHVTSYYSTLEGSCRLTPAGLDELVANCQGRAVIQREELGLAGWSATVNGQAAALSPSDGSLFTSVTVGRGTSTIVWSYRPGHLRTGEALALLGVVLLLAPFSWLTVRRVRKRT